MISTKHAFRLIVLVWMLSVFSCTPSQKKQQMADSLRQAEQQNKDYIDFTSDSLMKEVVNYYDKYGTASEQVRAHYILGCVYRDLKDAPMALQCYQTALEKSDTATKVCDYGLLCRIHSQMANLFHYQYLPLNELSEIKQAYHFAMLSHDTIAALRCYEHQANAYEQLQMEDSVLFYSQQAARLYKEIGDTTSANSALGTSIYIHLKRGDNDIAEQYIDMMETNSNILSKTNYKTHNFYNNKGLLYINKKDYPTARKYLFKALKTSDNIYAMNFTYKNLCLLFQQTGEIDSLAKYSMLYCQNNDSTIAYMSTATIQRMQSLYDYHRSQQAAKKAEMDRKVINSQNQILIATLLILILLAIFVITTLRNHKNKIINKKIKEIELLQTTVAQIKNDLLKSNDQTDSFDDSVIIKTLKERANKSEQANISELNELRETADKLLPYFIQSLNQTEYNMLSHEKNLCILIKAGFRPSEIAILLDMTPQNISNLRARLNKKIFNSDKGAKDFSEKIINIHSK